MGAGDFPLVRRFLDDDEEFSVFMLIESTGKVQWRERILVVASVKDHSIAF